MSVIEVNWLAFDDDENLDKGLGFTWGPDWQLGFEGWQCDSGNHIDEMFEEVCDYLMHHVISDVHELHKYVDSVYATYPELHGPNPMEES
jgi:hypothetical protein